MLVLKINFMAKPNMAFSNSENHRHSKLLHCITPSLDIT